MDTPTSLSFLYCWYVAIRWLVTTVGLNVTAGQLAMVFSLVASAAVIGLLVASELLFGDILREAARIFNAYARQHRGEPLGYMLRRYSAYVKRGQARGPTTIRTELTDPRFNETHFQDLGPDEQSNVQRSWADFSIVAILVVLSYVVLFGVATVQVGISWLLALTLLVATLLAGSFFDLWYSRYGLFSPEARRRFLFKLPIFAFPIVFTYAGLILIVT